ncbi:hypothetical protein VCSRO66_3529 [Vibrio cholerae]|nr:hypothetical protein [Vibrio cholerae]EGR3960160.1 hypothetical protein [Vibrio cholerae]GHX83565.1 hypothetical protein VCSRO66_3529 [Vibrio cholerae]
MERHVSNTNTYKTKKANTREYISRLNQLKFIASVKRQVCVMNSKTQHVQHDGKLNVMFSEKLQYYLLIA